MNKQFNKKKKNGNKSINNRLPLMVQIEKPPPYNAVQKQRKHYRHIFSDNSYDTKTMGSGSVAVISAAKLGALECVAISTTVVVQLFEAIRLRRIKIWAWADQTSTTFTQISTISVTFEGGALGVQGDHRTISDMVTSTSQPAVVDVRLNDTMQAGQWQSTDTSVGSNALFQVSAPANSVIDIWMDVKATRNLRTTANSIIVVGSPVAGGYYYLPLDNGAGGTGSGTSKIIADPVLVTTV